MAAKDDKTGERVANRFSLGSLVAGVTKMLRGEGPTWSTVLVIAVLLGLLPGMLSTYYVHVVTLVIAYAIAVLGLDLIVGRTGLLSFGQAAFLAIGSYGSVIAMMNLGMSFGPSILVAVAFAALIGALLAVPAARLSGLAFAFITFGLGIVTQALLAGQLLNQWTMGGSGLFTPIVSIFGNTLQGSNLYYFAFALLILCMTIYGNLVNSRSGRALSTLKESEPVALALGIPVQRYKMWSFALGAAFAGLSGVLLSQVNQFSSPDSFTLTTSITLMAMLILGGTRSMIGPLVGAAFFVLLPEFLHGVQDNAPIVFSAILLIMLIIAPQGLVGVFRNLVRRYSGGTGADPPPVPREGPGEIGPADVVSR